MNRLVYVNRDQLRPAVGFENWITSRQDLDEMRGGAQGFAEEEYDDEREEGPAPEEEEQEPNVDSGERDTDQLRRPKPTTSGWDLPPSAGWTAPTETDPARRSSDHEEPSAELLP